MLGWLHDAAWAFAMDLAHGAIDVMSRRSVQCSADAIYDVLLDVDPLRLTSCEEMEDAYRALAAELFDIATAATSRREMGARVARALDAAASDGRARGARTIASRIARMR